MPQSRFRRPVLVGLVMLLAVSLSAPRVHADWDDRSGSLPGIGGVGSILVLAGATVGAIFLLRQFQGGDALRATPARVELSPASSEAAVRLVNRSNRPIRVLRVDHPENAAFSLDAPAAGLPVLLMPGQALDLRVRFVSRAIGRHSGAISVTASDDRNRTSRVRIRLAGRVQSQDAVPVAAR